MFEVILVTVIIIEALCLVWMCRQERAEIETFLRAKESKKSGPLF